MKNVDDKGYIMDLIQLRSVQNILNETLQEIDRICRKHDIHYNIIAGTLLGAVRHKGFIPWDDDADVAMLRVEYDRFVEVCKTELDADKFYFQDQNNTPGYRWGYGKMRRKDTVFLREGQEDMPYEQGIFVDIFPLDHVSNNRLIRALQNFHCFLYRKIFWAPIGMNKDVNPLYRMSYRMLNRVDFTKARKCFNKYIYYLNTKETEWVRILSFPTPNSFFGYRKKWYENSSEYTFENHLYYGPEDHSGYLSFKFGEYMVLPRESDRKMHPVSELKLPDSL